MSERHDIEDTAAANGHSESSLAPVLAASEARAIEPVQQAQLPVPVVAAAGGAVVGAAAFLLLRILRRPARRRAAVRLGRRRGRSRGLEITGSRSFLVDVHMLKR